MPFVSRDGTDIHYATYGTPDAPDGAFLVVPGLSADSGAFPELFAALAERWYVIALDPRGSGQTAPRLTRFRLVDVARDALAVLDAEGTESAHVLGISMGGMIGQELAIAAPERVRRLVLCCTTCGRRPGVRPSVSTISRLLGGIGRTRRPATPEGVADAVGDFLFARETTAERRAEFFGPRLEGGGPTRGGLASQLLAVRSFASFGRLHALRVPTLVIHGDRDVLVPTANAPILADAIPDARLEILPGGHAFFFEHHNEFMARVADFLGAAPPPEPSR